MATLDHEALADEIRGLRIKLLQLDLLLGERMTAVGENLVALRNEMHAEICGVRSEIASMRVQRNLRMVAFGSLVGVRLGASKRRIDVLSNRLNSRSDGAVDAGQW
jgi:hypothetical protein